MDKIGICEVYYLLESDWNLGGILQERPSNIRRGESTGTQLHRMGFNPPPDLSYRTLEEDQRALYRDKLREYGLIGDNTYLDVLGNMYTLIPTSYNIIENLPTNLDDLFESECWTGRGFRGYFSYANGYQDSESLESIRDILDLDFEECMFTTFTDDYDHIYVSDDTANKQWLKVEYK